MSIFDSHVRGESQFIDDLPEPRHLLHAAVVVSPIAHGRLLAVDTAVALAIEGVVRVLTAADISGVNQIGGIIEDEELFAANDLHFIGQPVALVLAESRRISRRGAAAVTLEVEEYEGVFDPREAAAKGLLISGSRTINIGDVDEAFSRCHLVVEGCASSGAQEHLYLETQGAMCLPLEGGRFLLHSSTQAPTVVQRITAKVLAVPMQSIEVEVKRLGGAFGGKEDQATPWAVMAALGAQVSGRPVKIVLSRHEDLRFTGKRHPYSSDFKLGLDENNVFVAYEATLYQNSGAAADLSTAILERSLLHSSNAYLIPHVRVTGIPCKTNLAPNTAFRGFGAPQAMFVLESAISEAANALGIDRIEIQRNNLLAEGDLFPFGMVAENPHARRSFADLEERHDVRGLRKEIEDFNMAHKLRKRGLALMPVCFGISFTSTFLNQAGALVHVYTDGSVAVSTGAVEMGQGVNVKILNIAAHELGIPADRITVTRTSTTTVANTSPTAASSGADMNGMATQMACSAIRKRLVDVAAEIHGCESMAVDIVDGVVVVGGKRTGTLWNDLVWQTYFKRINLTAQAHYATPGIHYDRETETGKPFAYHVFGAAAIEVSIDCLRGTYDIDRVRIVHDGGRSLAPSVDRGQVEGGVVQGLGWMLMEEIDWSNGRLLADSLSTYKIPDIHSAPDIECVFLDDTANPHAVLASKAIGEPPFMYAIGAYFALIDAIKAYRPDIKVEYEAPMTPEKVLKLLHG